MRANSWSQEETEKLKKLYPVLKNSDLLPHFQSRSKQAIHTRATLLKLKKNIGVGGKFNWNAENEKMLKKLYPNYSAKYISKVMGCTVSAAYKKAELMGLKKSDEYMAKYREQTTQNLLDHGSSTRFKKGRKACNKGLQQSDYMSAEAIENSKIGQFRKGNSPHNELYDGYITIRKDSNTGLSYKYIRIRKGEWQLYARYVWEQETGEMLQDDEVIRFKNGNQNDCNFENLKKVSNAENLKINMLSDTSVVKKWLGVKDEDLQKELLENHPELLELTRNNVKLKMKLNERRNKK